MVINKIDKVDLTEIESLLIDKETNLLIHASYNDLIKFDNNMLSYFCYKHGFYQIPTTELINFLREEIGDLTAIEIGSGNGCIGRSLNIKTTDNKLQNRSDIKLMYSLMNQPTINYPNDIEEIDANSAVKKYKPNIVIGSWISDINNSNHLDAVREEEIMDFDIKKYIHIGNDLTHSNKVILKRGYRLIKEKWLVSRSMNQDANSIYILEK